MSFFRRLFTGSDSGKPTDLEKHWTIYTTWLQQKLPQYHRYLNPGADEGQIAALKSGFPFALPAEILQLYRLNNGDASSQQEVNVGTFMQFEFLPISKVLEEHKRYTAIINEHPEWVDASYYRSFPENTVRKTIFDAHWIPLFADGAGNFIVLDLNPDANGIKGQVINFGRDEHLKFQIARSLTDFLVFISGQIENGNCDRAIVEEDEGGFSYGIYPESHLIDDLKELIVGKQE